MSPSKSLVMPLFLKVTLESAIGEKASSLSTEDGIGSSRVVAAGQQAGL